MTLIEVKMPAKFSDAREIIHEMRELLTLRRHMGCSRKAFLRKWGKLRAALYETPDYIRFQCSVRDRSLGLCEKCGEDGFHVHHIKPVSRWPELALDPNNGENLCEDCHEGIHPHMRRKVG